MIPLSALEKSDLTDYIVKKLKKIGVETIHDLLIADQINLCRATKLTRDSFIRIKNDILQKYGPVPTRMSRYYLNWNTKQKHNLSTGIPGLDSILKQNTLCESCLLEICGFVGTGKTIFCLTMALNFATEQGEVLYISTKADYIGSRIFEILKTRNINKNEMGQIMQKIKIQFTFSIDGVINILKTFHQFLRNKCADGINNIKLIIIDSLYFDEMQEKEGRYLLTCLANLMRNISKAHFISFVFVNLLKKADGKEMKGKGLHTDDLDAMNNDSDIETSDSQHFEANFNNTQIKPALGKFWLSVPTIRLSLEKNKETNYLDETNTGVVRVLKSCLTSTGKTYNYRINKAGIL